MASEQNLVSRTRSPSNSSKGEPCWPEEDVENPNDPPETSKTSKPQSPMVQQAQALLKQARVHMTPKRAALFVGLLAIVLISSQLLLQHGDRMLGFLSGDDGVTPVDVLDSAMDNDNCPRDSSEIARNSITIDGARVKALPSDRLEQLAEYTEEVSYARRMVNSPGQEHYRLLQYLTQFYGDCRHVVDVGTGYAASALALGANGLRVRSFDLPSNNKEKAYRGKTEEVWYNEVVASGVEIEFFAGHLLNMPQEEFVQHFNMTWLIFLDTLHLPYTKPFEREFFNRLMLIGFKGLLVLDDIHGPGTFGGETERWWYELIDHEEEHGYKCHDVTEIGHFSGTGIVDFSNKLKYIPDSEKDKRKKRSSRLW